VKDIFLYSQCIQ